MGKHVSDYAIKRFLDISKDLELSDEEVISHYTSVSALKGMLENLTFRASHVFYMNDPSDSVDLYDSVIKVIKFILSGTEFYQKLVDIELSVGISIDLNGFEKFDKKIFEVNEISAEWIFEICCEMIRRKYSISRGRFSGIEDVYVISFVRDSSQDLINHWMSYGKDGFGVKIDLSVKSFIDGVTLYFKSVFGDDGMHGATVYFGACLYESTDQIIFRSIEFVSSLMKVVQEKYNMVEDRIILYKVSRALTEISALIKHSSYKNENECRLLLSSLPIEAGQINYNVSGSLVQPYRLVGLNWNSIEKIICGPRSDYRSEHAITHLSETLRYQYIQEISEIIKIDQQNYFNSSWYRFMPPSRELNVVRSLVKYVGKES